MKQNPENLNALFRDALVTFALVALSFVVAVVAFVAL